MWSTSLALGLLALSMASCAADAPRGASVCPERGSPPRYVEVFDGDPKDMASLVPDVNGERAGHWQLGYVYDAGRSVTVRCKYADRAVVDVPLTRRVARCGYVVTADQRLSVDCR